jgi:hypothetical protein
VTWKADGTRYMVAIMRYGTYLVDRKFQVRRVQVSRSLGSSAQGAGEPVAVAEQVSLHHRRMCRARHGIRQGTASVHGAGNVQGRQARQHSHHMPTCSLSL